MCPARPRRVVDSHSKGGKETSGGRSSQSWFAEQQTSCRMDTCTRIGNGYGNIRFNSASSGSSIDTAAAKVVVATTGTGALAQSWVCQWHWVMACATTQNRRGMNESSREAQSNKGSSFKTTRLIQTGTAVGGLGHVGAWDPGDFARDAHTGVSHRELHRHILPKQRASSVLKCLTKGGGSTVSE